MFILKVYFIELGCLPTRVMVMRLLLALSLLACFGLGRLDIGLWNCLGAFLAGLVVYLNNSLFLLGESLFVLNQRSLALYQEPNSRELGARLSFKSLAYVFKSRPWLVPSCKS